MTTVKLKDSEYTIRKGVSGMSGEVMYDTIGTLVYVEEQNAWLYFFKNEDGFNQID